MTNYMKKIYAFALLALTVLGTGCDDYLDINTDPNNPTVAPLTGLLANSTWRTGYNVQSMGDITSYYVQYLASPNQASPTDVQETVSYDGTWSGVYDIMTDLSVLQRQAREAGATDFLGVANVLKAIHLGMAVDAWGNIPYGDAFFAQTLNPTYDDSKLLYDSIQILLDEGIVALQTQTLAPPITENEESSEDFIYNGKMDRWVKAAHALKARYLLHLSKTDQYNPQAILAEIDQAFASSDDDAQVPYYGERINPWAQAAIANAGLNLDGWISQQLVQAMDGTTYGYDDPRKPFMYGTTANDKYVGTANGAGRGDAPAAGARSTLVEDSYYASRTAPIMVITYFEQKFIEAEAALDAGDRGRAYAAYLAGIAAHMAKIGVAEEDYNTYVANPAVSVGAANLTIDLIMKEKYIAMYLHPEAWTDARRYNYQYANMTIPENLNPDLGGQFIRRLSYPDSELTRNGANVPSVTLSDKIWWDQ